jgi:amino acid transporter
VPNAKTTIGIYAVVLFSQGQHHLPHFRLSKHQLTVFTGLINTFGVRLLKYLNNVSVFWHAIGTFCLVVTILAKAPTHQSRHFVFATFLDGTGAGGVGWSVRASPVYVAAIGILMAQYTMTGTH